MLEQIELNKSKEIVDFKGDLQLSFDEVLKLAEEILKERDESEMSKGLDIDRYDSINGLELAKKHIQDGGVWGISPNELELISAEQSQIDGIVELSKYDDTIKHYLLLKVVGEFFDDLENHFADWFGSQGSMFTITEEKLDKIITGIEETCNENIEFDGLPYHCDDVSAYGCVPKEKINDTREWIIKTLKE